MRNRLWSPPLVVGLLVLAAAAADSPPIPNSARDAAPGKRLAPTAPGAGEKVNPLPRGLGDRLGGQPNSARLTAGPSAPEAEQPRVAAAVLVRQFATTPRESLPARFQEESPKRFTPAQVEPGARVNKLAGQFQQNSRSGDAGARALTAASPADGLGPREAVPSPRLMKQ